jgi:SAM-dependent methyltransferase
MGFFDGYPAFYGSSAIGSQPNRLNARYRALIECNAEILVGARILDIASHDGRWSFAALHAGAEHVVGIEPREGLVARACQAMDTYGISADRYDFIVGDALDAITRLEPGSFDVVFCFGFLYHTLDQMAILSEIARLKPAHLIVDTAVAASDHAAIVLRFDDPDHEGDAVRRDGGRPGPVVVGMPSRPALEMMLHAAGFSFGYIDWSPRPDTEWQFLAEYRDGRRVTLRAELSP